MDFLSDIHPEEPRELIADIQETSSRSTRLLENFDQYQNSSSTPVDMPAVTQEQSLIQSKLSLQGKLSRVIAATTTNAAPGSNSSLASGYAPNYQGIYIRTPSGVQTRLFDYITPISSDTHVESVDIDRDGDTDYIYILDGILYVKYSWMLKPNKIIDNTLKISQISSNDLTPYIPDYFHENVSTPKNIGFSFVPASHDSSEWRAEFYDQYTEWDNVDSGNHDPLKSPKTTIDMFLQIPNVPIVNTTLISTRVPRSLRSVGDR